MTIPSAPNPLSKRKPFDTLALTAYVVLAVSFAAIVWVATGLLGSS